MGVVFQHVCWRMEKETCSEEREYLGQLNFEKITHMHTVTQVSLMSLHACRDTHTHTHTHIHTQSHAHMQAHAHACAHTHIISLSFSLSACADTIFTLTLPVDENSSVRTPQHLKRHISNLFYDIFVFVSGVCWWAPVHAVPSHQAADIQRASWFCDRRGQILSQRRQVDTTTNTV